MKFLKIIFISVFALTICYGQNYESGAFAAPVFKYTKLNDQSALLTGGRVGWIINKQIVLGAGYYATSSNIESSVFNTDYNKNLMLRMNYGGLEFEYLLLKNTKFNLSFDMLLAGGGVSFYLIGITKGFSGRNLLVWEPQVNIEMKLTDWLHADAGVSYRMISSYLEVYNITRENLQSINLLITLKFGKY
jgi:hypothetical protein